MILDRGLQVSEQLGLHSETLCKLKQKSQKENGVLKRNKNHEHILFSKNTTF